MGFLSVFYFDLGAIRIFLVLEHCSYCFRISLVIQSTFVRQKLFPMTNSHRQHICHVNNFSVCFLLFLAHSYQLYQHATYMPMAITYTHTRILLVEKLLFQRQIQSSVLSSHDCLTTLSFEFWKVKN